MGAHLQMTNGRGVEQGPQADWDKSIREIPALKAEGTLHPKFDPNRYSKPTAAAIVLAHILYRDPSHYRELILPPVPVGAAVALGAAGLASAIGTGIAIRSLAGQNKQTPSMQASRDQKNGNSKAIDANQVSKLIS